MSSASQDSTSRFFFVALAAITVVAAVLRIAFLTDIPLGTDDCGVITSAFDFMKRGHYGTTMWHHPKLRDIVVYGFFELFGGGILGIKGASLVFGILTVPMVGLLARRLFASAPVGLLAAFFQAIDAVHIDFSRQSIQEVYMPLFAMAAMLLALRYREKRSMHLAIGAGLLFGLGVAAKWYVVFPLAVTCAALALDAVKRSDLTPSEKCGEIFFLTVMLGVLPFTVYLVSFFPWFVISGHDLWDWVAAQRFMAAENLVHQGYNAYTSELSTHAALWFVSPTYWVDFVMGDRAPVIWAAISNPFVWMLTLPACCALLYKGIREKRFEYLYLSACFWASYLPLVLSSRPIWLNTSFAVTPFAFMAVSWGVLTVLHNSRRRNGYMILYLSVVLLTATPLYILAVGKGYDNPLLQPVIEKFRPSDER